jgi:glutathione synthase/RimK-type ligase-like ATP-grasp enzyme
MKKRILKKIAPKLVIFSRHPTHNELRKVSIKVPVLTSIRFGSVNLGGIRYKLELNKPEAIKVSSNKALMKRAFTDAGVKTADWWLYNNGFIKQEIARGQAATITAIEDLPYPIVAKSLYGSRGIGNFLLRTQQEFTQWLQNKDLGNYIFEKFYNYTREYRLHVSVNGCFYTCRKMLKSDTPEANRWYRNDSNCVWIVEENEAFNKPQNWDKIVQNCIIALDAVGLDVAAFDVKVRGRDDNDFVILESNSAPSFGDITIQKYAEEIPKIIQQKLNQ